jgi:hypothetical protein
VGSFCMCISTLPSTPDNAVCCSGTCAIADFGFFILAASSEGVELACLLLALRDFGGEARVNGDEAGEDGISCLLRAGSVVFC